MRNIGGLRQRNQGKSTPTSTPKPKSFYENTRQNPTQVEAVIGLPLVATAMVSNSKKPARVTTTSNPKETRCRFAPPGSFFNEKMLPSN
jgi:hypothetical protein